MSLATYLEEWLEVKERQVKPRTIAAYRYEYEQYLQTKIAKVQLGRINVFHLQSFLGEIADKHGARTSNGCRSLLYSALRQAVRQKVLPSNPVEGIPRVREEKKAKIVWSLEEINRLFATAKHHRLYPLFYGDGDGDANW
jgi:integrase